MGVNPSTLSIPVAEIFLHSSISTVCATPSTAASLPAADIFRRQKKYRRAAAVFIYACLIAFMRTKPCSHTLFKLCVGFGAKFAVQYALAYAYVLGRDFKKFVVGDEFKALFKAHALGSDKP